MNTSAWEPGPIWPHATASLSPGAKGFLDRRQRFFASRSPGSPKAPGQVSQPGARSRARPCQLAQSNRNLFLDHPTKGPDAQRFFFSAGVGRPSTGFERHYETIARPFEWRFTRHDLTRLLRRLGLSLPKMLSGANTFEISAVQEHETEA